MDPIHSPHHRSFISDKIHLKSYIDQLKRKLDQESATRQQRVRQTHKLPLSDVKSLLTGSCDTTTGPDSSTLLALKRNCHVQTLTVANELGPMETMSREDSESVSTFSVLPIPEEGLRSLKTLQLQQNFLSAQQDGSSVRRNLKYPNNVWFDMAPGTNVESKIKNLQLLTDDFLVVVKVYRPIRNDGTSSSAVRFAQEIHLRGSNTLADLRDIIKCPLDFTCPPDSDSGAKLTAKGHGPHVKPPPVRRRQCADTVSGFIYIEGCFYNETRYPDCIDYSQLIRDWAANPRRKLGPFITASLSSTKLSELTVRLGYPYVYVHQGDHEHLLSFVDVRLFDQDDPLKAQSYPYERSVGLQRPRFCMACCVHVASVITTDNERLPEDPFFFCLSCYKAFNLNQDGHKIGSFSCHNYVDPSVI